MPAIPPSRHEPVRRVAFLCGVACIVALVLLSWLPATEMARTGFSGKFEHFIAYAGTASVFAIAAGGEGRPWLRALALVALAGVLETGQIWAPGRTASAWDWAAGGLGVVVATLLAPPVIGRIAWLGGRRRD